MGNGAGGSNGIDIHSADGVEGKLARAATLELHIRELNEAGHAYGLGSRFEISLGIAAESLGTAARAEMEELAVILGRGYGFGRLNAAAADGIFIQLFGKEAREQQRIRRRASEILPAMP